MALSSKVSDVKIKDKIAYKLQILNKSFSYLPGSLAKFHNSRNETKVLSTFMSSSKNALKKEK